MTRTERSPSVERQTAQRDHRRSRAATPLWILAVVAATIAVSLGSRFFVPLTLGLILAAVVQPIVTGLRRIHVPQSLGAAVAILVTLVVIVLAVTVVAAPVRAMKEELPKTLMMARRRLASLGVPLPGANPVGAGTQPAAASPASGATTSPTQMIARAFGLTAAGVFALVEILLLAFFVLAAGDAWKEKIRRASRSPERAEHVLDTICEIRRVAMRYLFVNVLINAAQGVLVASIVALLGYSSPVLWGTLTFVAEFVPYLGGAAMIGLLFLAGLATGQGFVHAILAPGAYLLITTLQNNLVSPAAYGRSLQLNPTAILAGVMFWAVIWGVAGVFLAVPLLAAARIIAGKTETLAPLATFLAE